ncbi:hypothetical protein BM1_02582 [Bipolaris maydis]|nr:hypothetical protein BM1_02582 [Bipolaris maydis]
MPLFHVTKSTKVIFWQLIICERRQASYGAAIICIITPKQADEANDEGGVMKLSCMLYEDAVYIEEALKAERPTDRQKEFLERFWLSKSKAWIGLVLWFYSKALGVR